MIALVVHVQLTTFAVLTIIGAVFALIQLVIAATGAAAMDKYFDKYSAVLKYSKVADVDCGKIESTACEQVRVIYNNCQR